ncbi:hypothetical protein [Rhodopseudomonas sp. B29]|uniref:hypothetical protein n=1 Tax=Rhodopseudomonas sp. B29 TaxID=95607 RepID=UPI0011D28F06|nr:hypothetical protein [Rhodopseudomonas sp. B29]
MDLTVLTDYAANGAFASSPLPVCRSTATPCRLEIPTGAIAAQHFQRCEVWKLFGVRAAAKGDRDKGLVRMPAAGAATGNKPRMLTISDSKTLGRRLLKEAEALRQQQLTRNEEALRDDHAFVARVTSRMTAEPNGFSNQPQDGWAILTCTSESA